MRFYLTCGIWLAGVVQLCIAAANFFLPTKLRYCENLAKVVPIIRQIFWVHSAYIVLMLIGFAAMCFLFAGDLAGSSALGRFLCVFLALFWGSRAAVQVGCYDRAVKAENPLMNLVFIAAFLYLGFIFAAAALFGK